MDLLAEQANKNSCEVHAWCLMTNHVHLLISPHEHNSVSSLMKGIGQRYVQYINRTCGRSGTLWEGINRDRPRLNRKINVVCPVFPSIVKPVGAGGGKGPTKEGDSGTNVSGNGTDGAKGSSGAESAINQGRLNSQLSALS